MIETSNRHRPGAEWLVLIESNTTGSGRLFCVCGKRLGLRPVVFTRDPARYPYIAVDHLDHVVVDTSDPDAVLAACARLGGRVAGVTSSSEYSIAVASEAARALGLPHQDPAAVRACRDKHLQRRRLRAAGIPGAAFAAAATPEAAAAAAAEIGLPVVVKPVAGSGSVATRKCAILDEVRTAARTVLDSSPAELGLPAQEAVIVEEYVAGPEFSVETLGEQVIGIVAKRLGPEPHFVEIGHDFPAPLAPAAAREIREVALAALHALGLGSGPAHVELRMTDDGPRLIEVNPRLAGGMIPRMVEEACGIDMTFQTVADAAALGKVARRSRAAAASIRFLVAGRGGQLVGVGGVDQALGMPHVVDVGVSKQPGEVVVRHSFQDRLAYLIAGADDSRTAARAAEDALGLLTPIFADGIGGGR